MVDCTYSDTPRSHQAPHIPLAHNTHTGQYTTSPLVSVSKMLQQRCYKCCQQVLGTKLIVHARHAFNLTGRKLAAAIAVAHDVGDGVLAGEAGASIGLGVAAPCVEVSGRVVDHVIRVVAAALERVEEAEPVANLMGRRLLVVVRV